MNERIKELAEKAGGYVSLSYEHDGKLILSGEDIVKKFAELIVKECARAIITDSRLNDVRSAANGCVRTINEHFGVE